MATYEEIYGKRVEVLDADPTLTSAYEGQVWYNSTSGDLKTVISFEAWSSSTPLITATAAAATLGTQTAALITSGYGYPTNPSGIPQTQIYNGSGWTTGGTINEPRVYFAGAGITTAGVVFGGIDQSPPYRNAETEEYNGTSWSESGDLAGARAQVAGTGTQTAAMCIGGDSIPTDYDTAVEDYNGSSWTAGTAISTGRSGLAGNGTSTSSIVYGGGVSPGFAATGATEEWNGTAWSAGGSLNTARNKPGGAGADATSALCFGGSNPPPKTTATESYDGTSWTAVAALGTARSDQDGMGNTNTAAVIAGGTSGTPNATEEFNKSINTITAAAWASSGNYPFNAGDFSGAGTTTASIAFGGKIYPGPNAVTNVSASYDGSSWTVGPSITTARGLAASAKNGTTTAALCTGGYEPSLSNKCEEFNGSSWTEGPNYPVSAQFGDQGVGTQTAALISGGYGGGPGSAYLDATSTYNGSSWTALSSPSNLQDSRFSATATGTSTAALMLAGIGGAGKVESWNGSAWSEQAEANTARTQGGSSGPSTDTLYFGGEGPTGVTEHWDGTSWSTRPAMGTARFSMASCGTATSALAIGGFTSSNSTEEYTGDVETVTSKTLTTE
jgi:hypothetical protein